MQRRSFLSRFSALLALLALPLLPTPTSKVRITVAKRPRLPESEAAIWVTRDKQRISVADMTDDHLRKTIFYLSRQHARLLTYAEYFDTEDRKYFGKHPWEWRPIYMVMLKEANHRNLRWV